MKKIWITGTSLLLSLALCLGVVGCKTSDPDPDPAPEKATISVTVNGSAQTNGGTFSATVGTAYTIVATASNETEVSASYVYDSVPTAFTGTTFTPEDEGSYAFTFTASGADSFRLTFNATEQSPVGQSNVTFDLGEHAATDAEEISSRIVVTGTSITLPAAPKAASGYVFAGWSDGEDTYPAGSSYTVEGDVTLTATYTLQSTNTEVTISFSLGDHAAQGAQVPQSQTVTVNTPITLPGAIDAEEGYLFAGWSDGTTTYPAGGSYTATATATLTAQWEVDPNAPQHGIVNGGFETGDLTGWTVVSGNAESVTVSNSTVFWEADANFLDMNGDTVQYYLQEGEYFLVTDEATEVVVKSSDFVLGGDGIITFKFGIAKNPVCYVALCDATTNEELIKVTNNYFADPTLAQVLLRRVMYANDYIGREVYIKIVDGATSDFGFLNFDDLKVSLTREEAGQIISADKTWAATYRQDVINSTATMGGRTKDIINAIRGYYTALTLTDITTVYFTQKISDKAISADTMDLTEYLSEAKGSMLGVAANTLVKSITKVNDGTTDSTSGFDAFELSSGKTYTVTYRITDPASGKYAEATFTVTVSSSYQIVNGGFETGDLTGWTILTPGMTGGVIGEETWWNEKGPYNQSGDYHLDGWNTGIEESGAWAIRSQTFLMGGSGYISVKMGGNAAAIKVYKADGTLVGEYRSTHFSDANFPFVGDGEGKGSWADMRTYFIDLSEYLGEQLYVELHDIGGGAWAHAFFDDVITYYEQAPDIDNGYDTVTAPVSGNGGGGYVYGEVQLKWRRAEKYVG